MKMISILIAVTFLFQAVLGNETELTRTEQSYSKSRYPKKFSDIKVHARRRYEVNVNKKTNQLHDIDADKRKLDDLVVAIGGGFERIVGGNPVNTNKTYPWMVDAGGCGASLVAPNVVLTAAHCGPISSVRIGRYDKSAQNENYESFVVIENLYHPNYNGDTSIDYDYLLLRLYGKSSYTPVVLDNGEVPLTAGNDVIAIGWGTTSSGGSASDILLEVELDLTSTASCQNVYSISDRMVCASRDGKDSCQGDSGGPLIDKATSKQIGVVSFGSGCAQPGYPGVYAKVQDQIGWINENIAKWTPTCDDYSNWVDKYNDSCSWYAANDSPGCPTYGSVYGSGFGTAQDACCYCGGGNPVSPPSSSTPKLTPSPTPTPKTTCSDRTDTFTLIKPGQNGWQKQKGCDWVTRKSLAWKCKYVTGAKAACPNSCTNCCRDNPGTFILTANQKEKDCAWAAENINRCNKRPTRQNCAVTCGECS